MTQKRRRDNSYAHTLVVSRQVRFLKSLYITREKESGYILSVTFFFSKNIDDVDKVDFCIESLEACKHYASQLITQHLENNPEHQSIVENWALQIEKMDTDKDSLSIYCPGAPGMGI